MNARNATQSSFLLLLLVVHGCAPPPFASLAVDARRGGDIAEPNAETLASRIDQVLKTARDGRLLSTERNASWQIMHAVICFGEELKIQTPDRGVVSALDYLFNEGLVKGFELSAGDALPNGRTGVQARLEPGSYEGQGHVDQWIAILAMAKVPPNTEIRIRGEVYTVEDLARQAQYDVPYNVLDEFSWTLIALTHFFPDEPNWTAAEDLELDWETLVEQEIAHEVEYSPCGGTHQLAGLVQALKAKDRLALPDSEIWSEAREIVDRNYDAVQEFRAADGRLSSLYFTGPGRVVDLAGQLASSGHLFEFVALAADDEQISEAWIAEAAQHLCELLERTEALDLDCGALYHALHGLKLYRARMR